MASSLSCSTDTQDVKGLANLSIPEEWRVWSGYQSSGWEWDPMCDDWYYDDPLDLQDYAESDDVVDGRSSTDQESDTFLQ